VAWIGYNFYLMDETQLTHLDESGAVHMVDVGAKAENERLAVARGEVVLRTETLALIRQGLLKKGDVLSVARVAGIMAAKKTSELIPLCHPLALTQVEIELRVDDALPGVMIEVSARTVGRTGVEMEALTAVSVAALTIYDMVKAVEKTARITNIRLVRKTGGYSGELINE
jgi:cyclic pyranopterin phosphate synthase